MTTPEPVYAAAGAALSLWTLYAVWRNYRSDARARTGGARAYQFKYQRHPFDAAQYFEVVADSRGAAERLAADHMAVLLRAGCTAMIACYLCHPDDTR